MLNLMWALLRQPTLLRPNLMKSSVTDIDYQKLEQMGIKKIVFDRDNTLARHLEIRTAPEVHAMLAKVTQRFEVVLVSNARITQDHQFGIRVLKTLEKKPYNFQEIERQLGVPTHQVCVVGDRLLTDVVLANRMGAVSILVEPIDVGSETPGIRCMRYIESWFLDKRCQPHPHYGDLIN